MSKLILAGSSMFILLFSLVSFTSANDYALDMDMRDALHSWRLAVEDTASIEELPKGVIEGDIYSTSYARAEFQVAQPSTDALESTYKYISSRCDDNLAVSDVTNVFALTEAGKELYLYLSRRHIVDALTESDAYDVSCTNVVKCFYDENFSELDKEELGYENKVRGLCEQIVEDGYDMMLTSVQALASIKEINYGDDMLINAKKDDGPFDILNDIEQLGNVLFTHNDTATEMHFYDVQTPGSYVDNNPGTMTPYQTRLLNEDEDDPLRRLPPTNGVDPDLPRSVYYDEGTREPETEYTPPTTPAKDFALYTDPTPLGGSPAENAVLQQALGPANEVPAASTLHNPLCHLPEEEEEEEIDILALAELQQQHTYNYNNQLDINMRIALASATKMLPEIEEKFGIDPVEIIDGIEIDPRDKPNIFNKSLLEGDDLEAMENGMRNCVDQFTEMNLDDDSTGEDNTLDANAVRKIVRKSITQPTEFTKCVMDLMCFETGDESGRGMFRIRGCTIPSRKAYGVSDDQKVISIEDTLDEFMNVCTSLEESGQLLEHNKTKDAWDHKLMRVNFADKFSYSLSVGFKPLMDAVDPAYEKRMAIENTRYLEDSLLGLNDNLGHLEQRNKYVRLHDPDRQNETAGINTKEQNDVTNDGIDFMLADSDEIINKEKYSQLVTQAATLDVIDAFIDMNTEYRVTINDTTSSIMENRQAEMKESQQKG